MIKQLVFVALCLILSTQYSLEAQKTKLFVGGNFWYDKTIEDDNLNNDQDRENIKYGFAPDVGCWILNDFQIGLNPLFNVEENKNFLNGYNGQYWNNKSKEIAYGGAVYLRKFFFEGIFRPFLGLKAEYLKGKFESTRLDNYFVSTFNTSSHSYSMPLGCIVSFNTRISIIGTFGGLYYSHIKRGELIDDKKFGIGANTLGNKFSFGFYYNI